MSEETKDLTDATAHEHEHEHDHDHEHEHEHGPEPIAIELEDLTEEGKKKAEEALKRPIADLPYTLSSQESRPGSVVALSFETTKDVFQAEQARLIDDLRKEAVLPGYRKGKAPAALLLRRLGEDAVRDTIRVIGTNVLRQENIKQNFKFITRPRVIKYDVADGQVSFEIEGEVEPKVELKEYKGLAIEVETHPLADDLVDQRLEAMRRQNAVMETAADDAAVNPDDAIVVDVEVLNEKGERMANLSHENQPLYDFKSALPEPVTSQIVGKKAGETVEAPVEHKTTNRRGEEVTHTDNYKVTIKEIKVSKLPALDDEFAKDLGDYESLDALKAKIRKDLEDEEANRERQEALTKLYKVLIEKNPVDLPKSLTAQQTYRLISEDQYQLQRYGLRLEHVVQDANKYLSDQQASADEMVKAQLILGEIAKAENLDVTDADVDQAIEQEAEKTGRKALAVRARLEATKQLDTFRQRVAQQKISDFLLANNTVNKVEAKPAPAEGKVDEETRNELLSHGEPSEA